MGPLPEPYATQLPPLLAAERVVVGQRLSAEVAYKPGAVAAKGPEPLANNAYKVELLRGTVEEALLAIA